jgi:hydrogenase/urease accessory protein HupE
MTRAVFAIALLALLGAGTPAAAHPVAYNAPRTDLMADGNTVNFLTLLEAYVFRPETEDPAQAAAFGTQLYQERFLISAAGEPCTGTVDTWEWDEERNQTTISGSYRCPQTVTLETIAITDTVFQDLFEQYDHYLSITVGSQTRGAVLSRAQNSYPVDEQPSAADEDRTGQNTFLTVLKRFTGLGVEHILLGFDHLLFLLAVIIVVRKVRETLLLVTAFTLAHSLTLILAGLEIITVSPRIVEPLIALSIAYMAVRNLFLVRKKHAHFIRERWAATFLFGLLHGLGFAGALREVSIPSEYFVLALVMFNVGVEIGQMIVLTVILPWLALLREKRAKWEKPFIIASSSVVAALALFWTVERLLQ